MAKNNLESFVQYGQLFELYGKILSDEKQKICEEYFSFNMTIAEIAESRDISRQAVFDAIHKACLKLEKVENALKLSSKRQNVIQKLEKLKEKNPNLSRSVDEIIEEL